LLDALQQAHVHWAELPYRGASGQSRYWACEWGIPVLYEEPLPNEPPPLRAPGQRGRLRSQAVRRHVYCERTIVIRSSSKQSRDEKTRIKRCQNIEVTDVYAGAVGGQGAGKQPIQLGMHLLARLELGPIEAGLDGVQGAQRCRWPDGDELDLEPAGP